MIKIEIGNSYSKITGLSASQEKELKGLLSYTVGGKNAFFSGFGPQRKSLLGRKGDFPTGLLGRVRLWIAAGNLTAAIIDSAKLSRKYKQVDFTQLTSDLYSAQHTAVLAAIASDRGTISMPTGTGKSRVIRTIAAALDVPTLVVVPSLEIKKQMEQTLKGLNNVRVENIDSKALKTLKGIDCLIIDEAHHAAAKTYQNLNKTAWTGIYHRYFLTATPFRNDAEEQLLFEAIAGQVIYQLTYKDAIAAGYIVPVEAYYLDSPKQATDAMNYQGVYADLVVNNAAKNVLICGLMARLHSACKSTLCLVRQIEHGEILAEMTGLPFVSGADEDSRRYIEQFNKGNIKVLIGTTGVLGEGVDTKPCEYVIIAGSGKAKSQFMQAVGRGVRTYPGKESAKIILIQDKSHKYLKRHFKAQTDILFEEYGVVAVKLELA